jgi:hypothetical protein
MTGRNDEESGVAKRDHTAISELACFKPAKSVHCRRI